MRRREFIALIGGAAAWPHRPRAQERAMPVVGFLGPALDTRQHWIAAFRKGLSAEGFVEGQNVTIDYRSADGEGLQEHAADLVRRQVAVIFASGPPAALAAKRSTQTIPIVFVSGGDPVQMGLVSSFNRPGGNVTGFYFLLTELVAKRLALLQELLPAVKRIAVLVNPTNAATADPTAQAWPRPADCSVLTTKSSKPVQAKRSPQPSWLSQAGGPKPCSSVPTRSLILTANNLSLWQRAMRWCRRGIGWNIVGGGLRRTSAYRVRRRGQWAERDAHRACASRRLF